MKIGLLVLQLIPARCNLVARVNCLKGEEEKVKFTTNSRRSCFKRKIKFINNKIRSEHMLGNNYLKLKLSRALDEINSWIYEIFNLRRWTIY